MSKGWDALAPVRKAIGAALGGLTGVGVVGILAGVGVDVAMPLASAIAGVLALIGTYISPPNGDGPSPPKHG